MDLGVYIHWPFCASKCPYCDFNSHVSSDIDFDEWQDAYLKELNYYYKVLGPRKIVSIFFGGGTPSLMAPEIVASIISEIDKLWGVSNDIEITLEANPTSVEAEKFEKFKQAGVNRVSLGVQALEQSALDFLGRKHTVKEALQGLEIASKNFDRYSFDLIYARPDQTPDKWKNELEQALDLKASHLSLYQLTIEPGTPFYTQHNRGDFFIPEEDLSGELYEVTQSIMENYNMPAYEISNHAMKGQECQHNLVYWQYKDYLGIGPGAHGRITIDNQKHATKGHRAPMVWLKKVADKEIGAHPFEIISSKERFTEALMMGLRLNEGILIKNLNNEAGRDWQEFVNKQKLEALVKEGLLKIDNESVKATSSGRQRLNGILSALL